MKSFIFLLLCSVSLQAAASLAPIPENEPDKIVSLEELWELFEKNSQKLTFFSDSCVEKGFDYLTSPERPATNNPHLTDEFIEDFWRVKSESRILLIDCLYKLYFTWFCAYSRLNLRESLDDNVRLIGHLDKMSRDKKSNLSLAKVRAVKDRMYLRMPARLESDITRYFATNFAGAVINNPLFLPLSSIFPPRTILDNETIAPRTPVKRGFFKWFKLLPDDCQDKVLGLYSEIQKQYIEDGVICREAQYVWNPGGLERKKREEAVQALLKATGVQLGRSTFTTDLFFREQVAVFRAEDLKTKTIFSRKEFKGFREQLWRVVRKMYSCKLRQFPDIRVNGEPLFSELDGALFLLLPVSMKQRLALALLCRGNQIAQEQAVAAARLQYENWQRDREKYHEETKEEKTERLRLLAECYAKEQAARERADKEKEQADKKESLAVLVTSASDGPLLSEMQSKQQLEMAACADTSTATLRFADAAVGRDHPETETRQTQTARPAVQDAETIMEQAGVVVDASTQTPRPACSSMGTTMATLRFADAAVGDDAVGRDRPETETRQTQTERERLARFSFSGGAGSDLLLAQDNLKTAQRRYEEIHMVKRLRRENLDLYNAYITGTRSERRLFETKLAHQIAALRVLIPLQEAQKEREARDSGLL